MSRVVRFAFSFTLLALGAAFGQTIIDVSRQPDLAQRLERSPGETHLKCDIRPLKPTLGYTFRFQTGYLVQVPMRQFAGAGHSWVVLTRVTPEQDPENPVYLADRVRLPTIPETNAVLNLGGTFLVGEGRYKVDWALQDERGRVCRASWHNAAELHGKERSAKLSIAPNTVAQIGFRSWHPAPAGAAGGHPFRATVFLHAAPLFSRSTKIRSYDRGLWLSSLVTLLESLHATSVRLVAFNLDQQKELFRSDDFMPNDLYKLARAMGSLELDLVDYNVLKNKYGHVDLLSDLVNREIREKEPSDLVVFLGPASRFHDKMPESQLEERSGGAPGFAYLQCRAYWDRGAEFPDSIAFTTKRLKGKTYVIHTPGDFAKAIAELAPPPVAAASQLRHSGE